MRATELLSLWESTYGELSVKLRNDFLYHHLIPKVLSYDPRAIELAVRQQRRLSNILNLLYAQHESIPTPLLPTPVRTSRQPGVRGGVSSSYRKTL